MQQVLAEGALLVSEEPGVVEVVLNRPERHNAITAAMYDALEAVVAGLPARDEVHVVVFRGAGGRAFAAGNEISEFVELGPRTAAFEARLGRLFAAVAALPQVTVAAVDGVCVGGGLALATHCDLRIATAHSRFGYPIARTLGNALSSPIVYRCAAVFGESIAREMLLASRLVAADRAYAVGAVMEVVEDLDAGLEPLLSGLLAASPATVRATKEQLLVRSRALEAAPDDDAERLAGVYAGPDFAEGVRAFLAKEKPAFGGQSRP
jgi:enoyl-CoA hydratase/carnithine racemase